LAVRPAQRVPSFAPSKPELIHSALEKARSRDRAAELDRKSHFLRLALSFGMQKRLIHHLLLLLALIFGPAAAASPAAAPQAADLAAAAIGDEIVTSHSFKIY
jgi:hypothetical protein